jgi:hypothetical protein
MQIYAIIIFYKPFEHMLFSYAIEGFLGWGGEGAFFWVWFNTD